MSIQLQFVVDQRPTMAFHISPVVHIVCVIVLISLVNVHAQIHVNDTCDLPTGSPGQCRKIKNCSTVLDLINDKKPIPELCGFDGSDPIICCDINAKWGPSLQIGDVSKQKCLDIYEAIEIKEYLKKRDRLRTRSIIGGVDAKPAEYPHMVALGYGNESDISWGCGGSLISRKYVLTAAHCSDTSLGPAKFVRTGALYLQHSSDNKNAQFRNISRIIIHPHYQPTSVYNDIALVELSATVKITDFVQPACLFTETNITDNSWSATGWGLTSFLGTQANRLQSVDLRPFTHEECQLAYPITKRLTKGIDFNSQVCAGGRYKDTCQGDSGGPLQVRDSENNNGYKVIGVTSFGKPCGTGNGPSVYTRVSNYIEWIESIVWPP